MYSYSYGICQMLRCSSVVHIVGCYCTNGIALIKCLQDDADAYLPRIGASLFLSPGGDKFVQFLFCFSRYVLYHAALKQGLYAAQGCPLMLSLLFCSSSHVLN